MRNQMSTEPGYRLDSQSDRHSPPSTKSMLDQISSPSDLRECKRSDLGRISDEVRSDMLDSVSQSGGHLGSGLGVVELTVALHYVFDTPFDQLIWDVSHQCYPHKILTGRREELRMIRKGGGISGFTCRSESIFDPFGAAHSSTSISAGLGFAAARDYAEENHHVVAVIGDGAITGGLAFEALNNAGSEKRRLIVILNDNNMSIAPPAGALSGLFDRFREQMPDKATRQDSLDREGLASFQNGETLFDQLGVQYFGPYDGHDVQEMVDVLERAKTMDDGPILIHVVTEKGKGFDPAEASADKYHGVGTFDRACGTLHKAASNAPSYTSVFAQSLITAATEDPKIVAASAAMPSGTGLDKFEKVFPERCYDVGIAEQHAVTFCGGLACQGFKPFVAIYSTFLQRAYDQIVHDIAIQRLPVRFILDRAGMVGADGVTHHGSYDITYLGCLPGFVLMAAADEAELMHMVATSAAIDERPSALRFPRGEGVGVDLPETAEPLEIGKGRILREGASIAILSYGSRLGDALLAAESLEAMGYSATVADARFAKPIDDDLVARLARNHAVVLTVEEGAIGGFSAQVVDSLVRQGREDLIGRIVPAYLPDRFIHHNGQVAQIAEAKLDRDGLVERALRAMGHDLVSGNSLFRSAILSAAALNE